MNREGEKLKINDISLPLLAINNKNEARFIGSSTLIGKRKFITCRHVVENLKPEESLGIMRDEKTVLKPLCIKKHEKYDFAGGVVNGIQSGIKVCKSEILTGMDIISVGYVSEGNGYLGAKISMIPRLLKGYVVRIAPNHLNRPTKTLYEISFSTVSGFSGAPVYRKFENGFGLLGMLYGSNESQVIYKSFEEIEEDGTKYKEKVGHIQEFGLFHCVQEMETWFNELFPPKK